MKQSTAPFRLGPILKLYRTVNEIPQKQFAAEVGISASTLCRIEDGDVACDLRAFSKLMAWMIGVE